MVVISQGNLFILAGINFSFSTNILACLSNIIRVLYPLGTLFGTAKNSSMENRVMS